MLNSSSLYGIELGGSGGNWGNTRGTAGTSYADGVAYSNNGGPGTGDRWLGGTSVSFESHDQVFYVDWANLAPKLPEPTTAAFSVFGVLLIRGLRRRSTDPEYC